MHCVKMKADGQKTIPQSSIFVDYDSLSIDWVFVDCRCLPAVRAFIFHSIYLFLGSTRCPPALKDVWNIEHRTPSTENSHPRQRNVFRLFFAYLFCSPEIRGRIRTAAKGDPILARTRPPEQHARRSRVVGSLHAIQYVGTGMLKRQTKPCSVLYHGPKHGRTRFSRVSAPVRCPRPR